MRTICPNLKYCGKLITNCVQFLFIFCGVHTFIKSHVRLEKDLIWLKKFAFESMELTIHGRALIFQSKNQLDLLYKIFMINIVEFYLRVRLKMFQLVASHWNQTQFINSQIKTMNWPKTVLVTDQSRQKDINLPFVVFCCKALPLVLKLSLVSHKKRQCEDWNDNLELK